MGTRAEEDNARASRVTKLQEQRQKQKAERDMLLAEMKADREHRAARGKWVKASGGSAPVCGTSTTNIAGDPATATSVSSATPGVQVQARVAALHAQLVAMGRRAPNEAAAEALQQAATRLGSNLTVDLPAQTT